jgi:hypothetical protein
LRNHGRQIGGGRKGGKLKARLTVTLGTNAIALRKAKATAGGSLLYSGTPIAVFDQYLTSDEWMGKSGSLNRTTGNAEDGPKEEGEGENQTFHGRAFPFKEIVDRKGHGTLAGMLVAMLKL